MSKSSQPEHGWNIRVVRHVCKAWRNSSDAKAGDEAFELQEVYYGLNRFPASQSHKDYHHGTVCLFGNSLDELNQTAHRIWRATSMTKAHQLEVLDCLCDEMEKEEKAA